MSAKELKFKLKKKSVLSDSDQDNDKETFLYVPVDETTAKKVKIAISQEAGSDIVEDMGLPVNVGDTVFIEIGKTSKQAKLTGANKIQEPAIHEPLPSDEFPQETKRKRKPRKKKDEEK